MVYTRGDLVRLFYTRTREIPSLDYVQGEWNGRLLDNNGLIMVSDSLTVKSEGCCSPRAVFGPQQKSTARSLILTNMLLAYPF